MIKGMTISDAAHKWVCEFNAIPQSMIERLMLFMAYYREEVKVEQRIERRPAKHKKKKRTAQVRQPLIRRIYTVTDFDSTALVKPEQAKRGYTKPDHEVNVRGHLRRYKSGKVVWVKPSVKYKGKTARHKEYEL